MTDTFEALDAALAGRYRQERELGRGGMATVSLAEELEHGRRIAVKVLLRDLGVMVIQNLPGLVRRLHNGS